MDTDEVGCGEFAQADSLLRMYAISAHNSQGAFVSSGLLQEAEDYAAVIETIGVADAAEAMDVEREVEEHMLGFFRQRVPSVLLRYAEALVLLRRFEYAGDGTALVQMGRGRCPCCGWPQKGHDGPGRYKGNAENTHEEGCSLDMVLRGLPAPRISTVAATGLDALGRSRQ